MKVVRVAFGVLGGVMLTSSALAADFGLPPPAEVPAAIAPPAWGFFVGGGACYNWANFDITFNESYTDETFGSVNTDSRNISNYNQSDYPSIQAQGWCGTAIIGYDWPVAQNFLLGVFADFDFQKKTGEFRHEVSPPYAGGNDFTGQIWNVGLGNTATVGARAGVLVTPSVLLYGLVGWSWSNATLGYFEGCIPNDCANLAYSQSHSVNGATFGAGIEALLAQHVSARVEYRFTDFGSITSSGAGNGFSGVTTADVTDQSVRVVLTFRP